MDKNQTLRRKRYTEEEKQTLLRRWAASGKTGEVFASQEGVGVSTLFKWKRRLGMPPARKVGRAAKDREAVKPGRGRQPSSSGAGKIVGAHGLQIGVGAGADEEALRVAVRAMASCG